MASGADSDHSMTWEDFFGSSTDLSPSILGIYDSLLGPKLTPVLPSSHKGKNKQHPVKTPAYKSSSNHVLGMAKGEPVRKESKVVPGGVKLPGLSERPLLRQVLTPTKWDNCESAGKPASPKNEPSEESDDVSVSADDQKNFNHLSPNVKRMLSSHSPVLQPKKFNIQGLHGKTASIRQKHLNIPLMGATSKITQASIDIYDSPKVVDENGKRRNESKDRSPKTVYDIPATPVRGVNYNGRPYKPPDDAPRLDRSFNDKSAKSAGDASTGRNLKSMKISPSKSPYLNLVLAVTNIGDTEVNEEQAVSNNCDEVPLCVDPPQIEISRPLSTSSIASSSSGSSCSGNRAKGGVNSAYLASIESLDDQSGSDSFHRVKDMESSTRNEEDQPCQMEMVCEEIVATEQVYVEDLRQVIEGYLYSWREMAAFDEDQLLEVFSNIEDVYKVNRSFLERLDSCGLDPVKISLAFVDLNQHFSVYGDYCTAYPETIRALTNMMKDAGSVQIFRQQQAKLGHLLPLGSYLLKPVQRILKYHLLLQNLVKYCECGETIEALNIMTSMAQHINDMKRKHEHAVRVQEIQSLLLGWSGPDLTTYGELCAEGTFRVFGFKAMRHAFLFDKMLLLTKHRDDGILAYKSHIMCNNLMLVESITGSPLSFHVIPWDSPRAQLTLQASSVVQKREWTLLLKRVILENYQAEIPTHARQLVMQLGQNKTDDDIIAEKSMTYSSMRKQLSAPEYLEKRKAERERRKKMTRKTTTATPAEVQAAKELCSECEAPSKNRCERNRYTSNSTVDLNDDKAIDKFDGCMCSVDSDFGSSQESFATNNPADKIGDSGENIGPVNVKNCLRCMDITENIPASYNRRNLRCRHAHTLEQQKLRSKSKEDFHRSKLPKIGTWRRKSEPGLTNDCSESIQNAIFCEERDGHYCSQCDKILVCKNCGDDVKDIGYKTLDVNMYNSKHLPKKIYQIKKKRLIQSNSTAKFYTDFVRNDAVLHISESTDSLNTVPSNKQDEISCDGNKEGESVQNDELDYLNVIQIQKTDSFKKNELEKSKTTQRLTENAENIIEENEPKEKPLEQIISQLLMENREFQQILKRHQLRNARRHQRLLKSHSNPEKILLAREALDRNLPKLDRQMSAIEDRSVHLMNIDGDNGLKEEEHIYETLRVDSATQEGVRNSSQFSAFNNNIENMRSDMNIHSEKSKSDYVRVSVYESDYVYLHFDDIKSFEKEVVYDIPKKIENPSKHENTSLPQYSNCSEIWKKMTEKDLKRYKKTEKMHQKPPNSPEVWLKEQSEHFTCHDKKSDSLPRTLENTGKLPKSEPERPHTIASEQVDLDYGSLIEFPAKLKDSLSNINGSALDLEIDSFNKDESLDARADQRWPSVKNIKNNFTNHPEHRVYRMNSSPLSLKNVISRLKFKHSTSLETTEEKFKTEERENLKDTKDTNIALNSRNYSRNLMQRFKSIIGDESDSIHNTSQCTVEAVLSDEVKNADNKLANDASINPTAPVELLIKNFSVFEGADFQAETLKSSKSTDNVVSPIQNIKSPFKNSIDRLDSLESEKRVRKSASVSRSNLNLDINKSTSMLPVYMQGSKSLGARIAEGDYMDPKKLIYDKKGKIAQDVNVFINRSSMRPDSLISSGLNFSSRKSNSFNDFSEQNTPVADDSIYERSFERIEEIARRELCRDSAVYSDGEETSADCDQRKSEDSLQNKNEPVLYRTNSVKEKRSQIEKILQELDTNQSGGKPKGKMPPPIPVKPNVSKIPKKDSGEKNKESASQRVESSKKATHMKFQLESKPEIAQNAVKTPDAPGKPELSISDRLGSPKRESPKSPTYGKVKALPYSIKLNSSEKQSQSGWVKQVVNKFQ